MTEENKKLEPVIPEGHKIVYDNKGWYTIPIDQVPGQPAPPELPA